MIDIWSFVYYHYYTTSYIIGGSSTNGMEDILN